MAKAKTVAKSASVVNDIAKALVKLEHASISADRAVAARSKDARTNKALVKRLAKRRAVLSRRKQSTRRRLAKTPGAALRYDLRAINKDLVRTTKDLTKARAINASNAGELATLKAVQRYTNAYRKAIRKADLVLGKRTKKRH